MEAIDPHLQDQDLCSRVRLGSLPGWFGSEEGRACKLPEQSASHVFYHGGSSFDCEEQLFAEILECRSAPRQIPSIVVCKKFVIYSIDQMKKVLMVILQVLIQELRMMWQRCCVKRHHGLISALQSHLPQAEL